MFKTGERKFVKKQNRSRFKKNIAILGGGNIGQALASGLVKSGKYKPSQIYITRRRHKLLVNFKNQGFNITNDNIEAVKSCKSIIMAVQPGQLVDLIQSIRENLKPDKHIILSTVTGVTIANIIKYLDRKIPVVRIMPNTAVAICESITCIANDGQGGKALKHARSLLESLGKTLVIKEEQMTPATALCACGVAFFLRSIRAASQGGIQIGFSANDALQIAAQTARGAASLLQMPMIHPEAEIDKVTTPKGCTIAGLNRMEQAGFSSAMIQGYVTATEIANSLFVNNNKDA